MFTIKQLNFDRLQNDNSHKREVRKYDFAVKYTNKSFGHTFLDYLGRNRLKNDMHTNSNKHVTDFRNITL